MITRCLNIDWLEVFAVEKQGPRDAVYFLHEGFCVHERPYGTPMYHEMFTLDGTDGEPLLEVRRSPKSLIFDPSSCHIRLCNRTCYFPNCIEIMQDFLSRYGYEFRRISRIDLCLDFVKFDTGDDPQRFVQRYMEGRYAKMNQVNLSGHARDSWNQRFWQSLSWGSKSSSVKTRLYNKTNELKEVKDKPYIRQAWWAAGMVDDMHTLVKFNPDGSKTQPQIWRLEFEIKSGQKDWFAVETCHGEKNHFQSYRNTLERYSTYEGRLEIFFSLVHHYFHFKHVEYIEDSRAVVMPALRSIRRHDPDARLQRKDRCSDKVLFRTKEASQLYKLKDSKVASATPKDNKWESLLRALIAYRETQIEPKIYKACNVIIAQLEEGIRKRDLALPWDANELLLLRRLIAERILMKDKPTSLSRGEYDDLAQFPDLFGEVDSRQAKRKTGGTVVPPSDFQSETT